MSTPASNGSFTRRSQFSSCDDCRRLRVACDAQKTSNEDVAQSCTRCYNKGRPCTFKWIKTAKTAVPAKRKASRSKSDASKSTRDTMLFELANSDAIQSPPGHNRPSDAGSSPFPQSVETLISEVAGPQGAIWLETVYKAGFETIFGTWVGRYGCSFIYGESGNVDLCVSINDVCTKLDHWMFETSGNFCNAPSPADADSSTQRELEMESALKLITASFAARWLPVRDGSEGSGLRLGDVEAARTLWRYARREIVRVMNRPSYRSMLTLFLFVLTPIPAGITFEEENDGICGHSCVQAGLHQIQVLRARQRHYQFSGSKVSSTSAVPGTRNGNGTAIGSPGFIMAESIAYWAALTFDTSMSLTLNCKSMLSSGIFGFDSEISWRLVRTCAQIFDDRSKAWSVNGTGTPEVLTEEQACELVCAATSPKLMAWKLTAVLKEGLRDGHEEKEVQKAFTSVLRAMKEFDAIFRGRLEACRRSMHALSSKTRLRWYHLMLHYHLSILMLVDIAATAGRFDLLAQMGAAQQVAEETLMDVFAFGLETDYIISVSNEVSSFGTPKEGPPAVSSGSIRSITVPLISVDPYCHHIVAAVQLVQKSVDAEYKRGELTTARWLGLHVVFEKTLSHLPVCSRSVGEAVEAYWRAGTRGPNGLDDNGRRGTIEGGRVILDAAFTP